jgi:hypothetical protein
MACAHSPHSQHCYHLNRVLDKGMAEYVCCWCGHMFKDVHRKPYPRHGAYLPKKTKEKSNAAE